MVAARRVRVVVRGLVQGVGFRHNTRQKARTLGLIGYVCNVPDGSVETEAEGTPEAIEEFVRWLGSGPSHSKIESVDVNELEPTAKEDSFEILR